MNSTGRNLGHMPLVSAFYICLVLRIHLESMRQACNGAAVCRIGGSDGKTVGKWDRSVTARSDGSVLELKLAPQQGCTVVFNVMCDRDATVDSLSFLEETSHCNIR